MNKPVVLFQRSAEEKPAETAKVAKRPRRRAYLTLARASVIVAGIGLAIVVPLGWGNWVAGMTNQTTDNAYLRADTTPVSAEVGGRIVRLLVEDYQQVKAGQLLMEIDPVQYQARVDQATAAVSAAQAAIRNTQSNIVLQQRMIEQAEAGLAALNADRERIVSEGQRQTSLTKDGWSTAQKLEAAIADVKRIEARIAEQQAEIAAQRQKLDVLATQSDQAKAELSSQQATLKLAQIDLDRTHITAPIDGVVGVSGAREGQYVRAGAQLVSVVPISKLYVVANFKETQLAKFRPGQVVSVTVDTFPGKELQGYVERLSPATGSEFSLLPPDNATGNFTKVAQRVGVRIALEQNSELEGRLRPGMSVVATVHTDRHIETTASLIE
ncbi:membrane fusion protein (multidrug efflux system) [Ochrobactrum daejeonense]|uniref:Membrane fusion protein (Multidrug efflux system) n=1 Tax=Brucella daejeonensis TaxID=659015 RepID=A0A7W9AXC2_9HYPH|nr:HlyD family secretion protein [Brucella daejeonensis]MBB5701974.1 membrane fusion protein (multidrug efflux system) [Brucella daejeonensis]